jgi:alkanesulfonate monooxygenase SsuD/methylene tetrahydromethanopterin reductase-like flavin-dependent oxidoreductase (luciferase family)
MAALFAPTGAIRRADLFAPLVRAASVDDLHLMANVAIAFPRNQIHLARQADDPQLLTHGRFTLGLGTRVRAQIEKRFGARFRIAVEPLAEIVDALNRSSPIVVAQRIVLLVPRAAERRSPDDRKRRRVLGRADCRCRHFGDRRRLPHP